MMITKRTVALVAASAMAAAGLAVAGLPGHPAAAIASSGCHPNRAARFLTVCAGGSYGAELAVSDGFAVSTGRNSYRSACDCVTLDPNASPDAAVAVTFYDTDTGRILGSQSWQPAKRGLCVQLGGTSGAPTSIDC